MDRNERLKCSILNSSANKLLLVGEAGVLDFAKELARSILCHGDKSEECNCPSCVKYRAGGHPDFLLLSSPGSIKKDEMLVFDAKVRESAILSKKKVYIIDNIQSLTIAGQNAFLKTLEDSKDVNVFILIQKPGEGFLLDTIHSRVSTYTFLPLTFDKFKSTELSATENEILYLVSGGDRTVEVLSQFITSYKTMSEKDAILLFGLAKERDKEAFFRGVDGLIRFLKVFVLDLVKYSRGLTEIHFVSLHEHFPKNIKDASAVLKRLEEVTEVDDDILLSLLVGILRLRT